MTDPSPPDALLAPDAPLPTAHRFAAAAIAVGIGLLALREVGSLDVGFHLKAGNQILSGGGWPTTDTFTFAVRDRPYVDTSWGFQVVAALAERLGGPAGLVLLQTSLVLAVGFVLYRTARLRPVDPAALLGLLLLGGVAAELRFEPRPELASWLLLSTDLYLLHRHAVGRPAPFWAIPAVHLVWANVHALFALGWLAIALFVLGDAIERRALDRRLVGQAVAAVAVGFANPYGATGVTFPLVLLTRFRGDNPFHQEIGEFVSPFAVTSDPMFPRVPTYAFFLVLLLAVFALLDLARQRAWSRLFVLLGFGALSCTMIRNGPLVTMAGLPILAWALPVVPALGRRAERGAKVAAGVLVALSVALSLRVATDAYYVDARRHERTGLGWNPRLIPVETADYMRRVKLGGHGFDHLNFGGFLEWTQPMPMLIDGRLEVMGEDHFEAYQKAMTDSDALEAAVRRWDLKWIAFPYAIQPSLLAGLSRDPRWTLAHVDQLGVVFVRSGPEARLYVDPDLPPVPSSSGPDAVRALPGLDGPARQGQVARWLGGFVSRQAYPTFDLQLGLFHLYRGETPMAEAHLVRAIDESDGAYWDVWLDLAAVLVRENRTDDALRCYRIVLEDDPGNAVALQRVAQLTGSQGPG